MNTQMQGMWILGTLTYPLAYFEVPNVPANYKTSMIVKPQCLYRISFPWLFHANYWYPKGLFDLHPLESCK